MVVRQSHDLKNVGSIPALQCTGCYALALAEVIATNLSLNLKTTKL